MQTQTTKKQHITKQSVEQETAERLSRIDKEFSDGFKKVNKYSNTVTIFGSARFTEDHPYYQKAREVGAALSKAGYTIVTGGGGGIMEAGNRGAYEAGGKSLGFNIELPHEQVLNPYTTDSMPFRYFFTRKVILAFGASAYVIFPGGYGTLDEFFEIITLIQTKKMPAAPIILVGNEFWQGMDEFIREQMLEKAQTISPDDELLYTITEDTDVITATINAYRQKQIEAGEEA